VARADSAHEIDARATGDLRRRKRGTDVVARMADLARAGIGVVEVERADQDAIDERRQRQRRALPRADDSAIAHATQLFDAAQRVLRLVVATGVKRARERIQKDQARTLGTRR